jgi:hypothetical protein
MKRKNETGGDRSGERDRRRQDRRRDDIPNHGDYPEREYGLGRPDEFVRSIPRVTGKAEGLPPCPKCGCDTLYEIEIDVQHPLLSSVDGWGIGLYTGCPACPFATPMMMIARSRS